MNPFSIANTTREEREEIVRRSLSCGGGGCDNCSACGVLGGGDPWDLFLPYIEGEKEIADVNREYNARYVHGR